MAMRYDLRMVLLSSPRCRDHNMLWVQELEVDIDGDATLVSRVVSDAANYSTPHQHMTIFSLFLNSS